MWISKHIIVISSFPGWAWCQKRQKCEMMCPAVIRRGHLGNESVKRNSLNGCNFIWYVLSLFGLMCVACGNSQCNCFQRLHILLIKFPCGRIHYFRHGFESGWAELTICIKKKQEHFQVTSETVTSSLSPHGAIGTFIFGLQCNLLMMENSSEENQALSLWDSNLPPCPSLENKNNVTNDMLHWESDGEFRAI